VLTSEIWICAKMNCENAAAACGPGPPAPGPAGDGSGGNGAVQRDHRADDEADEDMDQRAQDIGAQPLRHLRVLAQCRDQGRGEFVDPVGQVVAQPGWQLGARAVDDVGGMVEQPVQRIAVAADKADERPDAAGQHQQDDGGQDGHGDGVAARMQSHQPWRQHIHQRVEQQAGEQRGHQVGVHHQQQGPGGQHVRHGLDAEPGGGSQGPGLVRLFGAAGSGAVFGLFGVHSLSNCGISRLRAGRCGNEARKQSPRLSMPGVTMARQDDETS
jgi:hypothetical protein